MQLENKERLKMTVNEMIIEAITTDSRKRKARNQFELEKLGPEVKRMLNTSFLRFCSS